MATREELRAVLERADSSLLALVAAGTALASGVLHLVVAPGHFGEHVGQGLFMVTLGVLQILWALAFHRRATLPAYVAGIAIALGSLVVWIVAVLVRPPFQSDSEPADMTAYSTKALEVLTLLALVALPLVADAAGVRSSASKALPLLGIALLLGVAAGGGAYGAGLVGEKLTPGLADPDPNAMGNIMGMGSGSGVTTASTSSASMGNMTMPQNSTASSNSTNSSQKYDYSACMPGMDMPGCPADVAARYYAQQMAQAPPPDKDLPPVKVALTQDGSAQTGGFTLDNGTQKLLVSVKLADGGTGPYAALGPGGQGDLQVVLKAPGATSASSTITLTGSANTVGVDPATPASKGPWSAIVTLPAQGAWTLQVLGQGTNAGLTVSLTERFTT